MQDRNERLKTKPMMFQGSICIKQTLHRGLLIVALSVFAQDLSSGGGVQAWTYNYSISPNRNWIVARQWCRQHFTDMVAIQNQEEISFLNQLLPFNPTYYWIGLRKVAGVWTWVGTNNSLTAEAVNWAEGEPNNIRDQQDCVEIYIKRVFDTTKWNDESCRKRKGTVCYTASCSQHSCSAHAECVETIGNYTCQCHPGFRGPRCEQAIACKPLLDPEQGSHHCFHPYGPDRFNSSCQFQCELGFQLVGTPRLQCQANELWNHPAPLCQAQQCPALNHAPIGGSMNCSHPIAPYSYNSTCEFSCNEGYELNGQDWIYCNHTGQWTASIPACTVKKCPPISFPVMGNMTCVDAVEPFSFGSLCSFTCWEGYYLTGHNTLTCLASGQWSKPIPTCTVKRCNPIASPLHGSLSCHDPNGSFSFGSKCMSTCDEGFLLDRVSDTECTSLGTWSTEVPNCFARRCSTLNTPAHGFLVCSDPHGAFSFGSRCMSTCEEGFVLNGTDDAECTSLGTWSRGLPHCLAHPCPLLAIAPHHGRMNCSHPYSPFSYGSQCDFGCDKGFWLTGAPTMTCNSSGHWNQDLPTCQEEGIPVGTAMLVYTGVGAASAVVMLALIGLVFLIMKRFKKRELVISDMSSWGARDNPAFES